MLWFKHWLEVLSLLFNNNNNNKNKGYDTFIMMEGKYNKILFIEIIIEAHKINLN